MLVMNSTLTGAFDGRYVYSRSGSNLIKWDLTALGGGETVADVVVYNVTAPSLVRGNSTTYLSVGMLEGTLGLVRTQSHMLMEHQIRDLLALT